MKLNFKAILFTAVAAFMAASCVEGTLELHRPGLENVDATKVELTTVVSSDAARVRPFYVYELTLSSGDGSAVLDAKFVSDGQPLHGAVYSPAEFAVAHKNSYLTGADGTTLTVNGVTGQVVAGDIKVTAESGAYAVSGVVQVSVPAADGGQATTAYYDLAWAAEPVAVKFPELPTMTTLTKVLNATSNVANGTNTVTVQLSTDGWSQEFDMTTYQTVYKGTGAYLAVDFYSEDGYLAAGTYKAGADPANPQPGEFVVGYDTTVDFGFGPMEMKDWGTCWWTVDNAAPVAQKILSGEIYVAYDAKTKVYTINIDNGTQYAQFVDKIPALTVPDPVKPGGFDGTIFTEVLGATPQAQYNQVVLQLSTGGVTATMDYTTWQTTYTGTGKIFNLTIHAEADANGGTYIPTGQYDAADGTTDPFTWQVTGGMQGMTWGTYVIDVVDGTATNVELTEGTVWVGAKGGEYIINFESGDFKFRYTGAISALSCPADDDGGYVGDEGDAFDGIELVGLGGWIDYAMLGMDMIGLDFYTDGCTVTNSWWQYTYTGSGNHLKLEIYAEGGVIEPGEYEIVAVESAPTAFQVKAGDDSGGSEWCTITEGASTGAEKITEGTVTIEQDGDTYTLTIESPVCTARYIGPLVAPAQ